MLNSPGISENIPNTSNDLSEHSVYFPNEVKNPNFYGKPCLVCDKFDYYPTSFEIKQENGCKWNTFYYYCPSCQIFYKEYDCFEWSY